MDSKGTGTTNLDVVPGTLFNGEEGQVTTESVRMLVDRRDKNEDL